MPNHPQGREGNTPMFNRTAEDWILILLYALKEKPMNGSLMFMKQLFLLENELIPDIPGDDENLKFYPWKYGPYSTVVAMAINKLIKEEVIKPLSISGRPDDFQYKLTAEGIRLAEESVRKLSEDIFDKIKQKRRGWDQLGYYGIVKKVYNKYPEYTIQSKIREEVIK